MRTLRGPATLAALATLATLAAFPGVARAQNRDTRLWVGGGVDAGLGPRVRLAAEQELRVGADAGFDETHTEVGVRFSPLRWLRLGSFYRLAILDSETRHRLGADGEGLLPLGRARLRYRLRLQATTRPADDTRVVVRNRVKVEVRATRRVEPFAAVEIHHQASPKAEYRELRLYLGADVRLRATLDLTAFYLYQDEANVAAAETNHVLGVGLVYHFGDLRARDHAEVSD